MNGHLIVVRHGESEWNAEGRWTGTTDVHLSSKGFHEAALLGEKLKDIPIDKAYISQQIRTKETLEGILDASKQYDVSYEVTPALNERDYGELTGKNKWQVQKEIGEEAFENIRRGWNYPVPGGETLKDVYSRVIPFYAHTVLPFLKDNQTVLLLSHGNAVRALIKYIESKSDKEITKTEMIFGTILIYNVDDKGKLLDKQERHIASAPPPA